jgi:hypothetical protein
VAVFSAISLGKRCPYLKKFVGYVTERVVADASCAVLVVPAA